MGYHSLMVNNRYEDDNESLRDWRFEPNSREEALERRVAELEAAVSRLERELRTKRLSDLHEIGHLDSIREATKAMNIGALGGTLSSLGSRRIDYVRDSAVLPSEPHKAD